MGAEYSQLDTLSYPEAARLMRKHKMAGAASGGGARQSYSPSKAQKNSNRNIPYARYVPLSDRHTSEYQRLLRPNSPPPPPSAPARVKGQRSRGGQGTSKPASTVSSRLNSSRNSSRLNSSLASNDLDYSRSSMTTLYAPRPSTSGSAADDSAQMAFVRTASMRKSKRGGKGAAGAGGGAPSSFVPRNDKELALSKIYIKASDLVLEAPGGGRKKRAQRQLAEHRERERKKQASYKIRRRNQVAPSTVYVEEDLSAQRRDSARRHGDAPDTLPRLRRQLSLRIQRPAASRGSFRASRNSSSLIPVTPLTTSLDRRRPASQGALDSRGSGSRADLPRRPQTTAGGNGRWNTWSRPGTRERGKAKAYFGNSLGKISEHKEKTKSAKRSRKREEGDVAMESGAMRSDLSSLSAQSAGEEGGRGRAAAGATEGTWADKRRKPQQAPSNIAALFRARTQNPPAALAKRPQSKQETKTKQKDQRPHTVHGYTQSRPKSSGSATKSGSRAGRILSPQRSSVAPSNSRASSGSNAHNNSITEQPNKSSSASKKTRTVIHPFGQIVSNKSASTRGTLHRGSPAARQQAPGPPQKPKIRLKWYNVLQRTHYEKKLDTIYSGRRGDGGDGDKAAAKGTPSERRRPQQAAEDEATASGSRQASRQSSTRGSGGGGSGGGGSGEADSRRETVQGVREYLKNKNSTAAQQKGESNEAFVPDETSKASINADKSLAKSRATPPERPQSVLSDVTDFGGKGNTDLTLNLNEYDADLESDLDKVKDKLKIKNTPLMSRRAQARQAMATALQRSSSTRSAGGEGGGGELALNLGPLASQPPHTPRMLRSLRFRSPRRSQRDLSRQRAEQRLQQRMYGDCATSSSSSDAEEDDVTLRHMTRAGSFIGPGTAAQALKNVSWLSESNQSVNKAGQQGDTMATGTGGDGSHGKEKAGQKPAQREGRMTGKQLTLQPKPNKSRSMFSPTAQSPDSGKVTHIRASKQGQSFNVTEPQAANHKASLTPVPNSGSGGGGKQSKTPDVTGGDHRKSRKDTWQDKGSRLNSVASKQQEEGGGQQESDTQKVPTLVKVKAADKSRKPLDLTSPRRAGASPSRKPIPLTIETPSQKRYQQVFNSNRGGGDSAGGGATTSHSHAPAQHRVVALTPSPNPTTHHATRAHRSLHAHSPNPTAPRSAAASGVPAHRARSHERQALHEELFGDRRERSLPRTNLIGRYSENYEAKGNSSRSHGLTLPKLVHEAEYEPFARTAPGGAAGGGGGRPRELSPLAWSKAGYSSSATSHGGGGGATDTHARVQTRKQNGNQKQNGGQKQNGVGGGALAPVASGGGGGNKRQQYRWRVRSQDRLSNAAATAENQIVFKQILQSILQNTQQQQTTPGGDGGKQAGADTTGRGEQNGGSGAGGGATVETFLPAVANGPTTNLVEVTKF